MAIAFDATSKAKSAFAAGGGTTLSWSHTVGAGSDRALVVGLSMTSVTGPNTVTFNGVSMTSIGATDGTNIRSEQFILVNPPTGAFTVAVTLFSNSRCLQGFGDSYTGVRQTGSTGTFAGASGNSNAPSAVVTSSPGEIVLDVVGQQRTNLVEGLTVGAGQTTRGEDVCTDTVVWLHAGASEEAGAGSVTMSWSSDATDVWAAQGVPLRPSPGASDTPFVIGGRGASW